MVRSQILWLWDFLQINILTHIWQGFEVSHIVTDGGCGGCCLLDLLNVLPNIDPYIHRSGRHCWKQKSSPFFKKILKLNFHVGWHCCGTLCWHCCIYYNWRLGRNLYCFTGRKGQVALTSFLPEHKLVLRMNNWTCPTISFDLPHWPKLSLL